MLSLGNGQFVKAWLICSVKRPKDQNDAIPSHHEPQPYDISWHGMIQLSWHSWLYEVAIKEISVSANASQSESEAAPTEWIDKLVANDRSSGISRFGNR